MSFRQLFLERIYKKSQRPVSSAPVAADKLQAFSKKELGTAIQLYQHLKNMGNTFEDLIAFVDSQKRVEQTAHAKSALRSTIFLTREQRKHMKKGGGKRSRRNGTT